MAAHGTAAAGLASSRATHFTSSAANARVGAAGEKVLARLLNAHAEHAEIFHDLRVPGARINVDHAVLSGNKLLLIDTKVWKAGTYWGGGDLLFSNFFRHQKTSNAVAMSHEAWTKKLAPLGVQVLTPAVVVLSGSQKNAAQRAARRPGTKPAAVMAAINDAPGASFLFATYPGGDLRTPAQLLRQVNRLANGGRTDDRVVAVLSEHLTR